MIITVCGIVLEIDSLSLLVIYLVTKITSPTISVAVVNVNDRIVHLERSLPVIFQSHLCDMDYRWLEYGVFLTLVYTCFF
jgi:hypothetical protein